MRLWSLHPRYLDAKGIVACWREGLLAQSVLKGSTKGYAEHPQLIRFREQEKPLNGIGAYLHLIFEEADKRGYRFNKSKILFPVMKNALPSMVVTRGQLKVEWTHLLKKLVERDEKRYRNQSRLIRPRPHPLFRVVPGPAASWERLPHKDSA